MAAEPEPREPVTVQDPSDHLNRRRIDEILDAQERVLTQHAKANDLLISGEINGQLAQHIVYSAVVDLSLVSKSLFAKIDAGEAYWYGSEDSPTLGIIPHPNGGEPMVIESLAEYLALNPPIEFSYEEETNDLLRGRQVETKTEEVGIPIPLSLDAYDTINDFLRLEVELDLRLEEGRPTGKIGKSERYSPD